MAEIETYSKDQVVASLRQASASVENQEVNLGKLEEVGDKSISLGGDVFTITDYGLRRLLKELGVPVGFFLDLSMSARKGVIRSRIGALKSEESGKVIRRLRMKAGAVTSVLPISYSEIQAHQMVEAMPNWHYLPFSSDTDKEILWFRAILTDKMVVDDVVHGFDLVMSEVGSPDVKIDALTVKLICSNGALRARKNGHPYFTSSMNAMETNLFESVAEVVGEKIQEETQVLQTALEQSMERNVLPAKMLDRIATSKVPKTVSKKLGAHIETEGIDLNKEMSRFDFAQLVALVGGKVPTYKTRSHFERIAGALLGLSVNTSVG